MKRLLPYIRRYQWFFLIGLVFVVLKNFFQSASPQFIKIAIDSLQPASLSIPFDLGPLLRTLEAWSGIGLLGISIGLFLFMEIANGIFLYAMRRTLIVSSRRIEYDLRGDLFSHLQRLDVNFFNYAQTGDLMSRMTNDLSNVRDVLGPGIMYTANMVVSFAYVLPLMIQISPKLTLLSFVPLIVLSIAINQLSKLIHTRSKRVQEKLADISSRAQENFSGIRVIKAFVREAFEIDRFRGLNREYIELNMAMVRVRGLMMSSVILTIGLSVTVLLWYGGALVMDGTMTLGEFTAFNFYLAMLIWPMIALGWVLNIFQRGSAAMKRLNEIFETKPGISDSPFARPMPSVRGRITIKNLTFAYKDTTVLSNIDLVVEPGMTVAIVGHTGSGKSTLVNLIPRLYDVPPGMIFIDDREIHDIPLSDLRMAIGMVPQDNFLFSDSILQNVLFGDARAESKEVLWAIDTAQMTENISEFPEKIDTIIGERGITLSGGQKQRLAIARAILRKPAILILDDALSSVDTHTEEEILNQLRGLMHNRTTIMVSHRIQTIKNSDLILVMKDGRIEERGTHQTLLAQDGLYSDMHNRQLLEEEVAAFDNATPLS